MKKLLVVLAVLAALVGVLYITIAADDGMRTSGYDRLSKHELSMIRPGDIVLRKGFGAVSATIARTLNEEFPVSHCGIVVADSLGQLRVIHSVSASLSDFDGVQQCSIGAFQRSSVEGTMLVVRFRDTAAVPLSQMAVTAGRYLKQQIPFDNMYDLSDSTSMYCSEMVWSALKETYGYDIYPDKSKSEVVKFAPFFDTVHFFRVINHHNKK